MRLSWPRIREFWEKEIITYIAVCCYETNGAAENLDRTQMAYSAAGKIAGQC